VARRGFGCRIHAQPVATHAYNFQTVVSVTTLVELYAGTAALSLHLFGLKPPVSRIGSKQGYAAAIAEMLGLAQTDGIHLQQVLPTRVILVDTDPWVCATLRALVAGHGPAVAGCLEAYRPTKAEWECERALLRLDGISGTSVADAAKWLYVTAASRGGVGGFKGGHIRRPSVNGWIPSIPSLCYRLQAFNTKLPFEVRCMRAEDVLPFGDSVVYMDPPYPGRTGYPGVEVVRDNRPQNWRLKWLEAGATLALASPDGAAFVWTGVPASSSAVPNTPFRYRCVELTHLRKGQTRRSLTRSSEEWLHIFEPR
jgi:hypothetical protein